MSNARALEIEFELILYCTGTLEPAPGPTERLMERKGQSQELRKNEKYMVQEILCM